MTFSTIVGVFLKLPTIFLRICRWVLAIALNSKVSGFSGGFPVNLKLKKPKVLLQRSDASGKWGRTLVLWVLFVVISSILLFSEVKDGGFLRKKEGKGHIWEDKVRILSEQFNVSKDQVDALATLLLTSNQKTLSECTENSLCRMQLGDGNAHALKVISSEWKKFRNLHRWLARNIDTYGQCPVLDNYHVKTDLLSVEDTISSPPDTLPCTSLDEIKPGKGQNISRAPNNCEQEQVPMLMLKTCWWVLVGMVVNYKVSGFWARFKKHVPQLQQAQHHHHQQSQSSKSGRRWRSNFVFLWILFGVFASMWIFWSMNKNIISRRKETLASMCDERARMLQDQFNVSMNHVHALAILVSTFHHGKHPSAVDQKTFAEYTERTAFERPLTSGVAYALKVPHSEREQFEKQHGWTIKKMETEDQSPVQDDYIPEKLDPSPVQDEYAPVVFSQDTVSHIVSIDMMSGKEDRENILRARASGKGVLTSPFKLLKSNQIGVVLTFAVYNTLLPPNATPEELIAATEGYLGASFDVLSLVEKLLHQLASKQTIVVNVYDTTNASAPIIMYGPNVTYTGLWHLSNLDFGDPARKHEMHCRFKQKPPLPWSAITTSAGVVVIVLLVGHIFYAAVNRIAKVEDDFRAMRELKVRAEAADVAKSQFLATVSHEIRTPMNGVLGMLQMLMDTDLDATQQDFARTAQASGKALISLINEVLDQAKIDSGRLELEAVPLDPRAILDNVLSLFSDKSQEKGIELAVYVSDQVPEILIGDPGRFRQIITNLVGNSIKFTEEGHIFVSVYLAEEVKSLHEVSSEVLKEHSMSVMNGTNTLHNTLSGFCVVDRRKSWESFKILDGVNSSESTNTINLLVMVEDTGVGIPQDAQSRIFMPFMQADSSTSRTYGGTGIGLSISKCLVDLMCGEMGFVSEPGIGSTFAFTAVFKKGTADSMDMKRQQSDLMVLHFRGMKGLVVDGRSVRAEVTKYHLQRLGIHVDIAISPNDAFSCISCACKSRGKERVDMVLVDKEAWGKGSGLAFPRLLKELGQNGISNSLVDLPKMFLLTTSISSSELDAFRSVGYVDNLIMKPLRLSMLAACLQQAFGTGCKRDHHRVQPSTLQTLLSGKHILVIDDNIVNRRVAAGALKKYGALVTCADSGKDALTLLQPPHKFDACFMDVQMPEMDGFEATRQVRCIEGQVNDKITCREASKEMCGNASYWHIPILAMTADVIQATHEECARCGMDGYVSKPFEEEQLYHAVARFFKSNAVELMR